MEKESVPVKLISKKDAEKINHLIVELKIDEATQDKWKKKADVENWIELPDEKGKDIIKYLEKKIKDLNKEVA